MSVAPIIAAAARAIGPAVTRAAAGAAVAEGEAAASGAAAGAARGLTNSFLTSAVGQLRGGQPETPAADSGSPQVGPKMPSFPSRTDSFSEGRIGNLTFSDAAMLNNF